MHFSGFKKHTEALSTINQLVDIIRESEAACDSSSILKALASSDTWLPPLETCRLCDEEFRTYINVITVICQILLSRRSKVDWRRSEDGIIVRQIVDFIVAHSADALQKLTWAPEQAELMKCLTMLCGDENGNSEIHWKKLSTDHPLPSRVLYFLNDYESKQQFTLDSSMAEVPFTGSFLQMPSDGINLNWSSAFTSLRTPTPLNAGSHTKVNIAYAIDCVVRLNDLSRVTLLLTTNTLYSRLGSQSVDTNTDTSNAMQSATASFLEFLNATPAFVNANLDITLSFVCSALRLCFVRQFEYDAYSFDTTQNVFKCIKCLTDNLNDIYNRTFPMNAKLIEGVNVPPHVRNFLVIATAMQGLGSDTYKDLHKIETVVSMSSLHAVYERLHYLNDTMRLFTELIITAFAYNDEGIDSEGGIGISSDGVKREGDFDVGVTELWTVPQTTIMSAMQSALFILREFNARTRWATLARSLLYSANNIAYEVERLRDTNPSKQRTVGMGSCGSTTVDEYDISEEAFEELFSDQTTPMQSADIDVLESELKDQVKFATEAIACANVAVHADNFLRLNTGEEFFQCVLEIVRIDRCQSTSCLLRELLEPIRNHVRSIMSILWSRHSHFSPSDKTTALTMIELLNGCNHTNEILPIAVRSDASTPVNSPDPFGFVTLPQSSLDASLIAFAMNSLIDPVTVVPSTEYVGVATRLWELYLNPTRDASVCYHHDEYEKHSRSRSHSCGRECSVRPASFTGTAQFLLLLFHCMNVHDRQTIVGMATSTIRQVLKDVACTSLICECRCDPLYLGERVRMLEYVLCFFNGPAPEILRMLRKRVYSDDYSNDAYTRNIHPIQSYTATYALPRLRSIQFNAHSCLSYNNAIISTCINVDVENRWQALWLREHYVKIMTVWPYKVTAINVANHKQSLKSVAEIIVHGVTTTMREGERRQMPVNGEHENENRSTSARMVSWMDQTYLLEGCLSAALSLIAVEDLGECKDIATTLVRVLHLCHSLYNELNTPSRKDRQAQVENTLTDVQNVEQIVAFLDYACELVSDKELYAQAPLLYAVLYLVNTAVAHLMEKTLCSEHDRLTRSLSSGLNAIVRLSGRLVDVCVSKICERSCEKTESVALKHLIRSGATFASCSAYIECLGGETSSLYSLANATRNSVVQHSTDTGIAIKRRKSSSTADVAELAIEREASTMNVKRSATRSSDVDTSTAESTAHKHTCTHTHSPSHAHMHMLDLTKSTVSVNDGSGYVIQHVVAQIGSLLNSLTSPHMDEDHDTPPHMEEDDGTSVGTQTHLNATLRSIQILQSLCARILKVQSKSGLLSAIVFSLCDVVESVCVKNALVMSSCCEGVGDSMLTAFVPSHSKRVRMLAHARAQSLSKFLTTLHYENTDDTWSGGVQVCVPVANAVHMNARKNIITHVVGETETHASSAEGELVPLSIGVTNLIWEECIRLYTHFVILVQDCNSGSHTHEDSVAYSSDNASKAARCEEGNDTMFVREMIKYLFATRNLSAMRALPPITYTSACVFTSNPLVSPVVLDLIVSSEFQPTLSAFLKHTLYENVAEGYGASDNLSEILPDRKFKATGTRSFMGFGAPTYTSTVDMCRDWVTALNAIANTSSSTSAAADVIVNTLSSVFVDVETNREHFRNEDRRRLSATVSAVKALELLSDVCMASNRVDQLARVLLVAIKHHLHVDVDWDAGAADIKPHTQAEVVNHNIPSNGRNIHTQTNKCATICDGIGKNGINESVLAERLLLFVFDIVSQYHTTARADGHDGLKNMEYQSDKGKGKELPTSTNSTMKDDLVSIARSTPLPTASPAPPSLSPTPTSAPASCTPTTETDILDKEVCTFVSTGEQFTEQHWYFCYTCRLVKSEGCCSVCVQVCHPGHDVEYARFSRFFCDCGASGKKRRCSARTPRKRLSANNKNVGGTLAEGGRTTFSEDACDSYTHTSTRSRSPLMHLDKYIDNYNSVCNTVETGTDGTRLNPYSECTHAQMHACVTVLRNGGVFEKVWEFVSRHGDAIVSRPRDKRKFPDDESTLPWLPAYSTKSGAIEPVKLKRSAKGQPKPRPKFTFHTQALAVIPVTSTSSYLVCGLKSFITIAIADSHSKVLQDSHNENEPSGSERSESHLDTLHKYPVDFDVLFVARNLVRLSHVAIGGASACVVMTLDVTGGSLKKCLDVSVGLDVYDDAYIIDVQWLPGSQVMLAITTTHFVKVFDMSRDTIAPVFFHSISEYGSKCNETIVSSTFIPPKPNTCAHFRTNAHTNQDHPSTTESSIHSIGINADKSRNNLDVGESRSAFESVRLVENINTYGYSSRECMYLIVSTSIGALYGLSVGNRKETNFGTHSHKTIAKPICLPLLPSTLHGQSGIVEYMILARKLVVAYNDVCLISDFDTELECLVAFHWIKYSTLTPTLMHTSSSTSMPSANAQLKANSPKLRHVIPIHSTRDLAILTFEPSTKHGDNVKSKSSTASTSGPPLCLCLSVTEMRVVSRLDIPAIGLVGCSSSAVSMFDTSTGDDYRRYVLTMYEDGSFRRFDLPIRLLTKESDKFTVYTMNQWEPLRRGGVEAKMEALFCTPAPVTFFEDVVCVTPETNFSGPNLTQNYYNQDEIRSRLMNPKEFLTSAVRNTFDIDIRINKKRNHMVVVGIRVLLGNKSFSGLPSELVVLGRSHKVRENCNRWYSIPFTLSEVRQSALIDTITLSARKPFTKGKFIVIDSVEVYALPRTCISRLIGPSAVGISSSCSDKTLRTNGKDVQISPLASLYLGLRVLQLACLPMPTSTKSKTPMLGSTFKVLLSSELPVIAQLSSSVHIRRTAYSLLSSIFLNNEKSDVDKICDQALVRIAEQEAVKLREATATRIDKITDGFVFERLVLCLHSVSQRDPGVIDAHLNVLEWVVRVYSQFASDMAHCENVAGCHVRAFHCHERLVVALGEMLLHTMQYTNVDSIKSACEMAADLLLSTGPRTQAILANVLCNISLPHATAPTVIPKYAPSSSPTISRMSGEHDREGGADDSENVGVSKDVCRVGMTHLAYALIKLFPIVNMDVGNGSDYLAYMMVLYKSAVISEDPVVLDHIVNKCSDVIGTTHTHLHVRSNRTERILLCVVLLHKLACSSAPRAVKCAVRRGLVARGMLGWLSVALNYIAEEVWVKTNYSDLNRSTELLREHVSSQKIAAAFLSAEPNPDSIGMHPPSSTTGVDGTEISLEQQSQSDCIKNMQAASNVRRDGNNSSDSAIDVEGDAFALFPQLLTTHLLLLGQSLNKEFASTSEAVYSTATCMDTSVGVNSYVDLSTTLCILLNTPTRIPSPLRQQCKGLHYSINGGDKSKSYTQRDGYVYDKLIAHLREYVSVTPARKHPHDASTRSPLRTASYADVVNLRKLFTGAIVCCKLRPEYWQAYCARPNTGPKVLEFLGQCVFMLDADVRQMHVSLILRTVYTSEPKAKPKADEDNRPKCTAAPQAIPLTKAISRNVRTMVNWLLHNEEGTSSTSLPTRLQHFILSFALCVSGTISDRTNACKFLKCLWQGCESEQQQTMLDCGLTIWAEGEVARVGEKGTEFTHLLCWCLSDLDIRSQLLESKQKSISQRILAPLRTAVSRTRAHPNGHIYQQLSKLFDIQGYYLEKDVCDVCSGSETITTPTPSPLSENSRSTQTQALPGPIGGESTVSTWVSEKLGSASHMSKFTDNAQLHKLRKVQSIGGISLRIKDSHTTGSDRRRPKRLVKTINVYYTDIRSTPLGELKGKFSIWHKICSIDIAPAQRTAHVQFEVAVVTNNIMIEYMSFHTVADTSSSADKVLGQVYGIGRESNVKLMCPRCNKTVTDRHGICGYCGENAYQCHLCRNINYENLDGFLCNECGFCRYASFEYTIDVSPRDVSSMYVESVDNELGDKRARESVERELDSLHRCMVKAEINRRALTRFLDTPINTKLSHTHAHAHTPVNDQSTPRAPSRTPDIIGAPHATVVEQPALPHQRIGLSMFDNSATARLSEMDPFLTSHERARGVNQETPKGSLYAHTRAPRLTSVSQLTKVIQKFYNSQCKSNADSMSHSLRLAMTTNQAICLWRDSTSSVTGGTFSGKEYVNTSTSTGMHISAQLSAKSSSRVSHPGTSWTTMMPTSPCYGCTHHFINNVLCLLEQFLHATSGTGTSDVYESEGGNTSDQDKLGTHGSNSTVRLWVTLMRMDVVPLLYDCMSMDDSGVSWLAKRVLQTYLCRSARDNDGDKVQESVLALAKDASHIVCDRITQAIDFVFSHPNLSSDMIMAVSHREVALLCQLCSDPSNTLFEPYLRILIIYFFRGVGAGMGESNDDITLISPVLPHRTQRAAFAELVLLPLLKVLNRTCTWIDADVKEDECDDVLSQKRTQTLQQPHTQTNHNMHVMDEECCREYQNMYITADLDEWLADGNGVSYKAWANAQPKYTKECQRVHADGGTVSHDGVGNRMGSFDCPLSALFTNTAWLRFLLFCPSSISVRKETSKLIHQLCSGENRQHSFVLFLESCLANVGEQGAYADEYRVLFKDVVKSEETKRLLASKGLLELLLDLILTEIKGLSAGNTFTVHGLTQGLALKFYIEILVGHLEVTTVQQQFKSEHLVGRLLDAYLYLRGVPRPNCTKLTNDCAELMRSLLETLTSGTIEETQSYMAACIQSLDRFSQTDVQRPVFILEQLCNIVCPISVEPEILLILRKSRSQEEFIRGRMTRNPYNSSEIGPTMRDAKNKICVDLELLGLLDDDFGMELLVDGSIIGLDLPIRQVYERVWLKSAHPNTGLRLELGLGEGWEILGNSANLYVDDQNDNIEESEDSGSHRTPMEIVFRLQGLDGEATEEMISSFPEDDAKAGIDNDYDTDEGEYDAVSEHEETYAFTSVIGTCGGLQVLTKCLYGVEDFHAHSQMVDLLTRLLKACLIKSNVDLILAQQDVDTVSCLLKAITTAVAQGVDGDVIYRLICIVHVLLSKINTDDMRKRCLTHTTTPNVADKGIGENCRERDLELVLNMVCDAKLFRTVKIYRATSRILPLLTYSSAKLRETLVDRFMPYLEFSRLDVLGDDAESPLSRHHRLCLDCFCQMNMSLSRNKNKCSSRSATVCVSVNEDVNSNDDTNCMNPDACIRTQTLQETRKAIALLMVLDKRIPQRTLAYIVTQLPDGTTPFSTESEEWNVYLTRPALPYALRVLAAMCRMSSLVQTAVREAGGVGVLHRLEHVHSGIYNIGSLAENVLDVCMDVDSVREEVESMRAETRRQKRTLALLKRQRVLASMGLKVENTVPSHSSLIVTQPSDTRNEPSMDDLNKSILHHTPNNAPVIKAVSPTNVSGIDSLTEEDSGHTCIVCREGYHFKATSVLGIYTYTRRATRLTLGTARVSSSSAASTSENVALMSMGAPRERGDIGVLSGGTGVLGNTSNRCYTTVTSFNVIHTECHTEAALADRTASRGRATVGGYGGPRGEWDGAVLRNSDAKCNNLLPILGPETALSSYGKWVDKYFDGLEKCGRILHSGRVSLLVSDMTQLLIRYSLQISLNKESGGGSRQSNIVLIPYMTQMALFLMDHKGGSERSKITQQYNEYLSTCLTSVTSSESTCSTTSNSTTDTSSRSNSGVVIDSNLLLDNMVESLFIVSVDEWQTHRLRFLAQIIYNSTSPTSTSTSHAESMTSVMCSKESVKASFSAGVRSSVIMWCLVDRLHSILTPICISSAGGENMSTSVSSADAKDKSNSTIKKNADTTTQNTPEWAVQLFTTLRLKDLEVVQKCRKLIEEFGDWFPSESLQDLLISTDHLSLVMDNSPIVSAWL